MQAVRLAKALALVAVMASVSIAILGAGSASAVVWCKSNENPCAVGNRYSSGTDITANSNTGAVLATSIPISCVQATLAGEISASSGNPTLPGEIDSLTFSGCSISGGPSCVVVVNNQPYSGAYEAAGGGNGNLIIAAGESEPPNWTVKCGFFVSCTFTVEEAVLELTGGSPAVLTANEIELGTFGLLCPSEASWTAEYPVTLPKPLFVSAEP